jgi:hypothetical protein
MKMKSVRPSLGQCKRLIRRKDCNAYSRSNSKKRLLALSCLSVRLSVCLSLRMGQLDNRRIDWHKNWYLGFNQHLSSGANFGKNLTKSGKNNRHSTLRFTWNYHTFFRNVTAVVLSTKVIIFPTVLWVRLLQCFMLLNRITKCLVNTVTLVTKFTNFTNALLVSMVTLSTLGTRVTWTL